MHPAADPFELLAIPRKTTLTTPGGIALGYGPGPGLAHAIFWNRIGSLFSCYRPAVARLTVFDAADPHQPLGISAEESRWEPGRHHGSYAAGALAISEERWAVKSGLRSRITLRNTGAEPLRRVLCFHGQVEQWKFFDYATRDEHGQTAPPPVVEVAADPAARTLTISQPHVHDGLPTIKSIQTVSVSEPLAAYGFGRGEGDLRALWHEHGCLTSMSLRLGQTGMRYGNHAEDEPTKYRGEHPLYYFCVELQLEQGAEQTIELATDYRTNERDGTLADGETHESRDDWARYFREDVPQLDCDDEGLKRFWYYAWYVIRANRTAPGRHIQHHFTAPSKYMYWGPWIWDGYFHVLGEMWLRDPEVARDSIRAVLAMQFPNGYLPVCSGSQYRMCFHEDVPGYTAPGGGGYASYVPSELRDYKERGHPFEAEFLYARKESISAAAEEAGFAATSWSPMVHNEKTQTPLITVGVADYCLLRDDKEFAKECVKPLLDYDRWLWERRCDRDGRFNLWHGDESGWDNATRHFPVPAKPVDVQVHSIMHRGSLLKLLTWAGKRETASTIRQRKRRSFKALNSFWCTREHCYYDFEAVDGGKRTGLRRHQLAASALFPLLVDAQKRNVDFALAALADEQQFNTPYPLPTLAVKEAEYAPHGWGWNGPAWLQVNYFVIVGLLNAQQYGTAFELWDKTRRLVVRDGWPYSYELYDPETGTGIGCPDYSWQVILNHLIIAYFAGVRPDTKEITPALPPGLDRLAISNLPGHVSAIRLTREGQRYTIAISYSEPAVPLLDLAAFGELSQVSVGGVEFTRDTMGRFAPPDQLDPATDWEVIITCS
jgi:hypothetical protein